MRCCNGEVAAIIFGDRKRKGKFVRLKWSNSYPRAPRCGWIFSTGMVWCVVRRVGIEVVTRPMRECRTSERCISIGLGSQRADGLRLMRDMGLVRNALCSKLQVDVMLWACRRLSATVPTGVVVGFYCNIVPGMFYVLFYARHKSVDGQKRFTSVSR